MINKNSVLAIVPARGGSKRLPGKNLKVLSGLPLHELHVCHCCWCWWSFSSWTPDCRLSDQSGVPRQHVAAWPTGSVSMSSLSPSSSSSFAFGAQPHHRLAGCHRPGHHHVFHRLVLPSPLYPHLLHPRDGLPQHDWFPQSLQDSFVSVFDFDVDFLSFAVPDLPPCHHQRRRRRRCYHFRLPSRLLYSFDHLLRVQLERNLGSVLSERPVRASRPGGQRPSRAACRTHSGRT